MTRETATTENEPAIKVNDAALFDMTSFAQYIYRFVPNGQGGGEYVRNGLLVFEYRIPEVELKLDDPRTPNCCIGFSLCSPKDEFSETEAVIQADERMEINNLTDIHFADFGECADPKTSALQNVFLIPPRIVWPLYHFIRRAMSVVGRQSAVLPHWARLFMREMRKRERAKARVQREIRERRLTERIAKRIQKQCEPPKDITPNLVAKEGAVA